MFNVNNPTFKPKMLGLDFDWTIVNPKDGKTFPKDIDDWQWFNSVVPNKIKEYYDNNYMIVIFTNQSKDWKCEQIKNVVNTLNIPIYVMIATKKIDYKPNINIFNKFISDLCLNNEIDKLNSLFVGDALGRKNDFSDSDKVFAENIGIKWISPEDFFDNEEKDNLDFTETIKLLKLKNNEIIIMVGYPGSGKSTIAQHIINCNDNYICIHSDIYKTSSKMIKKATEYIKNKKSIIFDATNSSIKKRKEYVLFAQKYNYKIKCVHITTSLDISYKRNIKRPEQQQVPKIAFSVYTKYFEQPTLNEGFDDLILI